MNKRKILKNKLYLYLTEFFAGMSVMAVELGASRLLAPYFSSSQIVWTIIIGTIMIAMALGNIYGGRKADKDPNPDKLYIRMIIASVWIALIPVLGKYIIIAVSALLIFTINSNFLVIAAFAACMIIFVFPLFLLGTVTPSLVKYTVDDLDDSGKTVGMLNAFNTIGSIIGTFVPTFVTIPAVGTHITFLIFAGILLLLCAIYFLSSREFPKKLVAAVIVFVICCIAGHNDSFAFWEKDLAFEGESIYNYLQVKENDKEVLLSTNVLFGVQSVYEKSEGLTGMYYDYAMAAPMMADVKNKAEVDMLILGMGTGTYATQCDRYFSKDTKLNIEGVEIDEDITGLAYEYFHLNNEIPVYTYDGRAFLNAIDKKYDVIMVDAYQDITIPFQMSSVEFFTLVKEHLKDDGVMVVNMNMRGNQKTNEQEITAKDSTDTGIDDRRTDETAGNVKAMVDDGSINDYLADTISSVFSSVYTADVKNATNRELFASDNDDMLKALSVNVTKETNKELSAMMHDVSGGLVKYESGNRIMTDDMAPVELLGMRVIDDIIADEISYYKTIYNEKGIRAVIDSFI